MLFPQIVMRWLPVKDAVSEMTIFEARQVGGLGRVDARFEVDILR